MNSFNETDAAIFPCRLCFRGDFPLSQLNLLTVLFGFIREGGFSKATNNSEVGKRPVNQSFVLQLFCVAGISWVNWVLLGCLGVAAVCLLPVNLAYTRSEIDKQHINATITVDRAKDTGYNTLLKANPPVLKSS